jgi:hypothetical protein
MSEITGYTDPYPDLKGTDRVSEPCGKCGGSGLYDAPTSISWNGRGNGNEPLCLLCGGVGSRSILVSSARATARSSAKAFLESQAAEARAVVARVAWVAAGYDVLLQKADDVLAGLRHGDPLLRPLEDARERINVFSAATSDADAVTEALDAIEQRAKNAVPVPEGRIQIGGIIVSCKWKDDGFNGSMKIVVDCGDWKVYGTLPKALCSDSFYDEDGIFLSIEGADTGDRVSFTATLSRSAADPSFGFFSRPVKAVKL